MTGEATRRINVTLPVDLLQELKRHTGRRERNRFIVEATEKELRRRKLLVALADSAGAWSEEDHPDLSSADDVERYVREMRESWEPRPWEDMAAGADANG